MAPGKANSSKSICPKDKMLSGREIFKFLSLFSFPCETFSLNKMLYCLNGETGNQFCSVKKLGLGLFFLWPIEEGCSLRRFDFLYL